MLSKDIIKACLESGESIETLRNWVILRKDCNGRSGLFTLQDNISVLKNRGYKSLNNKSNVNKFNVARSEMFYNSILFTPLKNGLFKFNSEKKVLINYKGNRSTVKYKIPESYLNNKRLFLDFCIGVYAAYSGFGNKRVAEAFKITGRRVQTATSRNDTEGLFLKEQRKVLEFFPDSSQALKMAYNLKEQGIISSKPFQFNKDYAISLNTSNKITPLVLRRVNGKSRKVSGHTQRTERSVERWFKPVFQGKGIRDIKCYWEDKLNAKVLMFNESVYKLGDFISKHGNPEYV